MKIIITLCLVLVAVSAQTEELSLEQALRLAEKHSHQLKYSRSNLEAADKSTAAARSERWPTLSLEARAGYINEVPALDIDVPGLASFSRDFGSNESYQTDLRLTLPLFTGGRLSAEVEAAESKREYRAALEAIDLDQAYLQVRLDYLGLYRALRLQDAARASLKRTTIMQNDIKSRYEAGVADSVDMLEANLAHTKTDFALRRADINIRSHKIRLLTRLGLSVRRQIDLSDTLPDPPLTLAQLNLVGTRPEQRAAAAAVQLSMARVHSSGAAYYPTLSAYSGYSYGKPNIDPFSDTWNDYFTVGARLNWSLNLGGKSANRRTSAMLELDAARHRQDQVLETINRDIELAFEQLRLSHERYINSRLEFQITSENYRLARAQHESGTLSSNRLLEIEAALSEAQSGLAAAKVEFYMTQSRYYHAIGDEKLGKGI